MMGVVIICIYVKVISMMSHCLKWIQNISNFAENLIKSFKETLAISEVFRSWH